MLAPILGGAEPLEVVRVEGGLVNTIYRVTIDGEEAAYALRVYAAGRPAFEIERRLLSNLRTGLPVPEVIFADASGLRCAYPYLVYRWLKGITLNEARKQLAPKLFLTLAEPLGRLLARIGSVSFPDDLFGEWHCGRSTIIGVAARLAQAEAQLCTDPARRRLGDALADRLRDHLATNAPLVRALDQPCGLVHGDFGGRNILVKADAGGEWSISGVLDWESAAAGSALWDVGSLFRYPGRYSTEFRGLFAHGYHAAGGALSHDWCWTSRLLDATQLVATLSEEQELPSVYAECRELIESVVCGNEQAAA
ncbi:MAG TPA: aminoglycoside phosphotransferase family protein [Pyrinomonadaceae bacterium]|nr:aminoglycoside phosphotransferase family protein [Pyrinomonadaceae bacterium]